MAAALVPALAIPAIAALSGGDFPVGDALLLGLRMGLGGMLVFAIGLLLSTIFAGDFPSAPIGRSPDAPDSRANAVERNACSVALSLVLSACAWRVTTNRDF